MKYDYEKDLIKLKMFNQHLDQVFTNFILKQREYVLYNGSNQDYEAIQEEAMTISVHIVKDRPSVRVYVLEVSDGFLRVSQGGFNITVKFSEISNVKDKMDLLNEMNELINQ